MWILPLSFGNYLILLDPIFRIIQKKNQKGSFFPAFACETWIQSLIFFDKLMLTHKIVLVLFFYLNIIKFIFIDPTILNPSLNSLTVSLSSLSILKFFNNCFWLASFK
ncbi:hypothetical protein EELLY_v1c03800 [Entomoplasma ellychniae]|uniref:Uncharacterized protein n=1 Tax=Entomoplasma ellychniae TaxID=2114 RepID=A0A8E2QY25_9MOLU|nr:hypothetical protein EELLY_v1c00130 [Entomoplasma ellychniae]PPE04629.1 hypothetical protein EELLY_v1c03090 [Entomoplasma ellychniae]PPE04700.1 hypothetical protein EELLY_v1c03800 [Entomoplasma ellychniae]